MLVKSAMRQLLNDCKLYEAVDKLDATPLDALVIALQTWVKPRVTDLDAAYGEFLTMLGTSNPQMYTKLQALPADKKQQAKELVQAACELLA